MVSKPGQQIALTHSLKKYLSYKISSNTFLSLIRPSKRPRYLAGLITLILAIQILSATTLAEGPSGGTSADKTDLRFFGGYNWYSMEDFNEKLRQEGNKTIDGGLNVGIDMSRWIAKIPRVNIYVKVPVFGIEYLGASSKTTHTDALGSATVQWNLPVVGGYITADLSISDKITWLYLRPLSIGIYNIGELLKAGLTISDRPGRLDASGNAIGLSTGANFRHKFVERSPFYIFILLGYRWLKFTDVDLTPEGGFTVIPGGGLVQPSTLPESLDYGGFMLRGGVGAEF